MRTSKHGKSNTSVLEDPTLELKPCQGDSLNLPDHRETPEIPVSKKKEKGNDEDDSNNEQDSSGDDDKTQSENENESNSEHETDENESDSESDQDENKEEENDEEEVKDELVKTPSNDFDNEDETKITDKAEVDPDKEFVQEEGTDAAMTNMTEVLVTSSSYSSDLAAKFLNFSDIPHTDAKVVSPINVHVHHEVPSQQTPKLLIVPVSVITDSSPVFSTIIPQSFPSFNPPLQQSTFTPPPTTEATNPSSTLLDFTSVFQFNNRVTALEKEVTELKKDDPLKTQVTALVDEHLDARLGATRDEFMNFLSTSLNKASQESTAINSTRGNV
ncbi:hypothetical protein Tco_0950391 [Tanacetum coccineum]